MSDPISLITSDALTAWTAKTFGKSWTEKVFNALKNEWKKYDWLHASQNYCHAIEDRYGKIQVLGMTGHMQLDELFTDVHILKKLSGQSYLHAEHWNEMHEQLLLGKGYATCDNERRRGEEVAMDYIIQQFDVCRYPDASVVVQYLLSTGKAIVLYDGLDEVQIEFAYANGADRECIPGLAKKMGLNSLSEQFGLIKTSEGPSKEEVETFRKQLQSIMIEHRNIGHDWEFSAEQEEKLDAYLRGTKLLVNCLNVAANEDREKILSQISSPP